MKRKADPGLYDRDFPLTVKDSAVYSPARFYPVATCATGRMADEIAMRLNRDAQSFMPPAFE